MVFFGETVAQSSYPIINEINNSPIIEVEIFNPSDKETEACHMTIFDQDKSFVGEHTFTPLKPNSYNFAFFYRPKLFTHLLFVISKGKFYVV